MICIAKLQLEGGALEGGFRRMALGDLWPEGWL